MKKTGNSELKKYKIPILGFFCRENRKKYLCEKNHQTIRKKSKNKMDFLKIFVTMAQNNFSLCNQFNQLFKKFFQNYTISIQLLKSQPHQNQNLVNFVSMFFLLQKYSRKLQTKFQKKWHANLKIFPKVSKKRQPLVDM